MNKKICINLHPLNTIGGAEKVMLDIALCLSEYNYNIDILSVGNINRNLINNFFNMNVNKIKFKSYKNINYLHKLINNIFEKLNEGNKYKKIYTSIIGSNISKSYDIFINGESGDIIKLNNRILGIFYIFFPWKNIMIEKNPSVIKKLYNFPYNIWKKQNNLINNLKSYKYILTSSKYVKKHIKEFYGLDASILYPFVNEENQNDYNDKQNSIISVGRFFKNGHNKKFEEMINLFIELYKINPNTKYNIVGAVDSSKDNQNYADYLTQKYKDLPIKFHFNISRNELIDLYKSSKIFWHAAGYKEDLKINPEKAEHFGIVVVEAMRFGCVPIVFNAGGPPEIVAEYGYKWSNKDECIDYSLEVLNYSTDKLIEFQKKIINRSNFFSKENFKYKLKEIISDEK